MKGLARSTIRIFTIYCIKGNSVVSVAFILLPNPKLHNPKMYGNLGLLYVAGAVERAGYDVVFVDLRGEPDISESVLLRIPSKITSVCISATTGEISYAKKLNAIIKRYRPRIRTIIGGPHASLLPRDCEAFDVIVAGEGEYFAPIVVNPYWPHSGIYRQKRLTHIDPLAFPYWEGLPRKDLFSTKLMPGEKYGNCGKPAMTIITSRGCPFKCSFCGNMLNKPVVFRSPENVCAEVETLGNAYGVKDFRFEDDNFTLSKDRYFKMCLLLSELGITYKCHTRASLVTPERVKAAKKSGCIEMGMGLESGDDNVLEIVNKQERVEAYKEAIKIIQGEGLRAKVYLMSALPGETDESVDKTKEFMLTAKPDKWTLSVFTCYPGCDIWNNQASYGIRLLSKDFGQFWNFPDKVLHEFTDGTTAEELYQRYKNLYSWLVENCLPKTD